MFLRRGLAWSSRVFQLLFQWTVGVCFLRRPSTPAPDRSDLQKLSRQASIAAKTIEVEEALRAEALAAGGVDPAALAEEELARRINMRYAKAQSMANKLWTETYRHATPSRADPVTVQAMKAMHDEFEQVF